MAERVRVLGVVELGDPAIDATLGRGMARELLAYLVAQRRRPAPTMAIVDALWPDAPPATAVTIVHGLVRRLRQGLGADAVVLGEQGYALALEPGEVDLWAVDEVLASGNVPEARKRWREPGFGPYASRPWAQDAMAGVVAVLRPDPEASEGLRRTRRRVPVSRLVGRRVELAAVAGAARRSRLVSIVGLGGVGKTRLALEAVRQLDHQHVDFVDVGAAAGPAASRVAMELGVATSGDPERDLRTAASLIGRRRQVLVLDGCEHDGPGAARVVDVLLGACPDLTVLATARSALGVPGEHVVPLLPFTDPDDPRGDAVELLLDRAHGMGLALTVEDRERAAEICRRSAGVPLAIELGVTELVFGTERDLPVPASDAGTTPEEAVTSVVAHALSKLSDPTATTARRAALLVSGFTPDLAARLGADGAAPTGVLHELVASGLVVAETSGTARRLRFLDRVRDALRALADDGDRRTALAAVVDLFAGVRADLAEPISIPRLIRAVEELTNAQALLDELRDAGRAEDRLLLATAVADTWAEDGRWASGTPQMGEIIDAAPDADPMLRARAVRAWGAVTGTYDGARRLTPYLLDAVEAAQAEGDLPLEAHLRLHLANAYGYDGQLPEAYEQVLRLGAVGRELDSEYVQIGAASLEAMGRMLTGDAEGARERFADLARRLEDLSALADAARINRSLSLACRAVDDLPAALEALERSEYLAIEGHARGTLATVRTDIADLRFQQGDPNAVDALELALDADLAVGNLRAAGIIRTRLGELAQDPATIALGTLDLWHADRQWAAAALATLLTTLPAAHPLQQLGPGAIAALGQDWGTPLDAHGSDRVAPFLAAAGGTPPAGWDAEVEGHLHALATGA